MASRIPAGVEDTMVDEGTRNESGRSQIDVEPGILDEGSRGAGAAGSVNAPGAGPGSAGTSPQDRRGEGGPGERIERGRSEGPARLGVATILIAAGLALLCGG